MKNNNRQLKSEEQKNMNRQRKIVPEKKHFSKLNLHKSCRLAKPIPLSFDYLLVL